jgi:hypothetical protein
MGNHELHAVAQRGEHRQDGLGESADLVRLDEHRVDQLHIDRLLDRRVVGGHEVVAYNEDLVSQLGHRELPSLVVVLCEAVFERDDGDILVERFFV